MSGYPAPRAPDPARWIRVCMPANPRRRRGPLTYAVAVQHGRIALAAPAGWWLMGRKEREAAALLREFGGNRPCEDCQPPHHGTAFTDLP